MEPHWIDERIASLPGTSTEHKPAWGSMLYRVGDKMIGMRGTYKDGRPILTIKLPPAQGELLRETYDAIIPGYYSNKVHYNSVFLDAGFDDAFIGELIEDAYDCVFATLTGKAQKAITDV
ncbi:MAG: MmcQ/YjbR family DNA-binding protein [Thermomicrobiales bacterium]|nr:MmcQ/YjbR family DNA-binding protein [Thermomicrobiales bacterium]